MIHLLLLLVCVASIEVFIQSNFLFLLGSMLKIAKKVIYVISQNKISDHWKEKVIPAYALIIMKYSLQIVLILLLILSLFILGDLLLNNFLLFTFSLIGILETIVFALGYLNLGKLFIK